MNLGFVGLGNIGGPCVNHLIGAGHRVTVFDIDEAAVGRIEKVGARGAGSTADVAAASDAVLLSLPTPEASEAVVAGEGGVMHGDPRGRGWLHCAHPARDGRAMIHGRPIDESGPLKMDGP